MTGDRAIPVRMIHRNVLIGRDTSTALYRLDAVSYPYLPDNDKKAWLSRLARFAYNIGTGFSVYRACRAYPAGDYIRQAAGLLDPRTGSMDTWSAYLASHQEHIEALNAYVPEFYLAVVLKPTRDPNTEGDWRTRLRELAKSRDAVVPGKKLDALLEAERRMDRQISAALPARAATTREIQWLYRRAASRGVHEPALDENWTPAALQVQTDDGRVAYEPHKADVLRHTQANLVDRGRFLEVNESFQSMLAVGYLPDETVFPGGAEYLYNPLERVPFPVDFALHARWISNRDAAKTVRNKVVDADNNYEDALRGTHSPLSYTPGENRELARSLDSYVQSSERPPLLDVAITLAVGAKDKRELDDRVDALRDQYGTVTLERPYGLQAGLYRDMLPRPDTGSVRDYAGVLTVEQFGALMPLGTHHAGTEKGVYSAYTLGGTRRPVKQDVTQASRSSRPPTMLFVGTSGSGKTTASQLVAYQAFMRGSRITVIDPKGDNYVTDYPGVREHAETIHLSGDPDSRGVLDPLVIAPENMRVDLTAGHLLGLLPGAPEWTGNRVRQAIGRVLQRYEHPGCLHVVSDLQDSQAEDDRLVGDALAVFAESGVAQLAFSDGQRKRETPARAVRYDLSELVLPTGPGVHDEAERLGVATLKLALTRAAADARMDRARHDVVYLDEAHNILDLPSGLKFAGKLTRESRALNITFLLASQHVTDAGTLEDLVGYRFVFGQETERAARQGLQIVGLNPDDRELVRSLTRMRKGHCLFRDLDGNVCEMQVDVVDPDLLAFLNTDPNAARHKVAA